MKILMTAVSIVLAGFVALAEKKELCNAIDPTVCVVLDAIHTGLNT